MLPTLIPTRSLQVIRPQLLLNQIHRCFMNEAPVYIRLLILAKDPGFCGEMRDFLDKAEKNSLISSADQWMKIRELRNKIAHEYTKEDLFRTFEDILLLAP